jgi:methyltransferase (TIGR00027 family)
VRAGAPSETARRVAAYRLGFERAPAPWGDPAVDDRLAHEVAGGMVVDPTTRMARYLAARTAFFDRVVVSAVEGGITQVVVAAAGYDGRALRYARPGVRWFELDHPDTQADKRARLARLGVDSTGTVFAPIDFESGSVVAALAAAGHDAAVRSLFICEGVAGYLALDVLVALLTHLAGCAAPSSVLAITMSLTPETAEGEARRAQLAEAVAGMGEPLMNDVPRAELASVLDGAGWDVSRATDPAGVDVSASTSNAAFVVARSR